MQYTAGGTRTNSFSDVLLRTPSHGRDLLEPIYNNTVGTQEVAWKRWMIETGSARARERERERERESELRESVLSEHDDDDDMCV